MACLSLLCLQKVCAVGATIISLPFMIEFLLEVLLELLFDFCLFKWFKGVVVQKHGLFGNPHQRCHQKAAIVLAPMHTGGGVKAHGFMT